MPARHRDYSWSDPREIAALAPQTSGISFLTRVVNGEIAQPPIAQTLAFALVEAEPGRVRLEAHPAEFEYNAIGTIHGGVIATWADTSIGYAIQSRLPAGSGLTTLDLQVRYVKAVHVDSGPVSIEAITDHVGRTTGTAHCEIRDHEGRLLATATSTCLIVQRPAGPTDPPAPATI